LLRHPLCPCPLTMVSTRLMLLSLLGDPSSGQVEKHVIKRRTPDLYLLVRQRSLSDRDEDVGQFSIIERDVDVSLVLELRSGYSRGERFEPVLTRLSNHQCLLASVSVDQFVRGPGSNYLSVIYDGHCVC